MKLTQFIQTQPLVLSVLMSSAIVAIVWLSTREVVVGRLNVGLLFTYWGLLGNLINPMNRFAAFVGEITKALVGAGRVYEILDLPVERGDKPGAVALINVRGHIAFEQVTFAYSNDEAPVLDNLSVEFQAGEIVALVGPSGAGKTTIVNLVPRFYEPQGGRITSTASIWRMRAWPICEPQSASCPRRRAFPKYHRREHPLRVAGSGRRGSPHGGSRGERRRIHPRISGRVRNGGWRARPAPLGRPASAHR